MAPDRPAAGKGAAALPAPSTNSRVGQADIRRPQPGAGRCQTPTIDTALVFRYDSSASGPPSEP